MLAGHFATAILAKQRAPSAHFGYYLVAFEPVAALSGSTLPMLAITYLLMSGALLWAQAQPTTPRDAAH